MSAEPAPRTVRVPLRTVLREWTRIGVVGFGGPPVHITLLRELVTGRGWVAGEEVESAIAACNLLPGPASTQLSIYLARRVAGPAGAVIGGLGFIVPAVVAVTALSAVFLGGAPPVWIRGAGAGAGAAVAAVAVQAGLMLLGPSRRRAASPGRWIAYAAAGALGAALAGPYLVLVLLGCGLAELSVRRGRALSLAWLPAALAAPAGGLGALAWVALKVGALSYGGGFVIIPLMQSDAVHVEHWMSATHFLDAVALGQITPGPVVATVAAVGYAAHGVGGAALAAVIAFLPSFLFVLVGGGRFARLHADPRAGGFLDGAGPAALGAILGSAIPLALALREGWQFAVLAGAGGLLLLGRRRAVSVLLLAGLVGALAGVAGAPVPR